MYTYAFILHIICAFTNPSTQAGCDTKSILKQVLIKNFPSP